MERSPGLVARVEAGLVAAWARQGGWVPGASWHRVGGLVVALSDVPDQSQQVALVERDPVDPEEAVLAAEVLFARRGWAPAVDLVAGAHPRVEAVLAARGYRPVAERPALVRVLGPSGPAGSTAGARPSTAVGQAAVGDQAAGVRRAVPGDLPAVRAFQATGFGLSPAVAGALLAPAVLSTPGAVLLVADAPDGTGPVVGSVLVHLDRPAAGIVGLAVAPAVRRRGIGGALTAAALARAGAAGAELVWLQSTPMAERLYRAAGFGVVGSCVVWSRS